METVVITIFGAIINAAAFVGGNALYNTFRGDDNGEKIRHDKAEEELERANTIWNQDRMKALDQMNKVIREQQLADRDYDNVDEAFNLYYSITKGQGDVKLRPRPKLSDFYTPSDDQQMYQNIAVIGSLTIFSYFFFVNG